MRGKLNQAFLGRTEKTWSDLKTLVRSLQKYLAMKTLTSLATGLLAGLWVWLLGVDFPVFWGLIAFLFNYVPNIGSFVAAVPAVLMAIVQYGGATGLLVAAGYVVINITIGGVIEPNFMGDSVGLSPLVVFMSLVFWGWMLGGVGMLLSHAVDHQPEDRPAALPGHALDRNADRIRQDLTSDSAIPARKGRCRGLAWPKEGSSLLQLVSGNPVVVRVPALLALLIAAASVPARSAEYSERERGFWAFQPRSAVAPPSVGSDWVRSPVDAFVLRRLREAGLSPAPAADRARLARRAYFDVTGLPPTPAELETFLEDDRPGAWERLVDRLLASPRQGERGAQSWLDVVRYAETEGFEYDRYLPGLWRYRDYVIDAFNADMPFDQFVRYQLAGDELARGGPEVEANRPLLAAAGLHRLGPGPPQRRQPGGRLQPQRGPHRAHGHCGHGISRTDGGLRPLPRPHVRSDPPGGLLPPAGVLRPVKGGERRVRQ